ncbi:hypothetical protein LTR08_003091 [Meristemomyces frigidus]|nr:hypothetical protein LTR08_003091 [Meristemomyces frigidus]
MTNGQSPRRRDAGLFEVLVCRERARYYLERRLRQVDVSSSVRPVNSIPRFNVVASVKNLAFTFDCSDKREEGVGDREAQTGRTLKAEEEKRDVNGRKCRRTFSISR